MKTFYDNDLNDDFEKAYQMSEMSYSHEDLFEMLKNGCVVQKQIAAINIDTINTEYEARLLLNNLTGCDGKIRESVAYKINDILDKNIEKRVLFLAFDVDYSAQIFANATIDINGNICKFVLNIVNKLKYDNVFAELYTKKILDMINSAFNEIDKFIYKDKKYVINKQLFKLYWCLEALKIYKDYVDEETLFKVLYRASMESEYTIREKVAQVLSSIDKVSFTNLKSKLKNDANYYVRMSLG